MPSHDEQWNQKGRRIVIEKPSGCQADVFDAHLRGPVFADGNAGVGAHDLDIQARDTALVCGLTYMRAATVGTHGAFLAMLSELLAERLRHG